MHHSSTEPAPGWSLLRCPRCQRALEAPTAPARAAPPASAAVARALCERGGQGSPVRPGIPLSTARPEEWIGRWGKGLGLLSQWLTDAGRQLQVECFAEELSERGQYRVRQV